MKKDYSDLLYKTVTVLHKDGKTVFGVYATDDNTQQNGVLADLKMDSNKKVSWTAPSMIWLTTPPFM